MRCNHARELINPLLDGELGARDRNGVSAHMEDCQRCNEIAADIRRLRKSISQVGRTAAPKTLVFRVRRNLVDAVDHSEFGQTRIQSWWRPSPLVRQAATLAACCALSVLLTWSIMTSIAQGSRLEHEILAAHVRSLLQDGPPIQVTSSDTHTVKPWFAGRIDFAPDVKDLTAQGFQLLGGRLDFVQQRRVVALVYQRRLHIVNVFMWRTASTEDTPLALTSKNGYNLLLWNKSGVTYWAVSDLDARELRRLQNLLASTDFDSSKEGE
jgi:anti-sigma factor RsiW